VLRLEKRGAGVSEGTWGFVEGCLGNGSRGKEGRGGGACFGRQPPALGAPGCGDIADYMRLTEESLALLTIAVALVVSRNIDLAGETIGPGITI